MTLSEYIIEAVAGRKTGKYSSVDIEGIGPTSTFGEIFEMLDKHSWQHGRLDDLWFTKSYSKICDSVKGNAKSAFSYGYHGNWSSYIVVGNRNKCCITLIFRGTSIKDHMKAANTFVFDKNGGWIVNNRYGSSELDFAIGDLKKILDGEEI